MSPNHNTDFFTYIQVGSEIRNILNLVARAYEDREMHSICLVIKIIVLYACMHARNINENISFLTPNKEQNSLSSKTLLSSLKHHRIQDLRTFQMTWWFFGPTYT